MALVFRADTDRPMPPILRKTLLDLKWIEFDEEAPPESQPRFNLYWKTNRFFPSTIKSCVYPHQRVNHYPKSSEITKKDALHRHLKRMKGIYGAVYDFLPVTFVLPNEYVKFCQFYADQRDKFLDAQSAAADKKNEPPPQQELQAPIYICKPADMSRGRKIFVFDDIGDLSYDCACVVQRYVDRPMTIDKHKVDFRIYVLVTSFQPLRAYIYEDFLVRFSADKYNTKDLKNIFAHITNYSVNKNAASANLEVDGAGAIKWDATQTRRYFERAEIEFDFMFERIRNMVNLTLLSIAGNVPPIKQCFELYGFDIMFDADFTPWLIEVNFSPALATDMDVDVRVKGCLMADMVDTLNITPFASAATSPADEETEARQEQAEERKRLVSSTSPEPEDQPQQQGSVKTNSPSNGKPPPPKTTTANGKPPRVGSGSAGAQQQQQARGRTGAPAAGTTAGGGRLARSGSNGGSTGPLRRSNSGNTGSMQPRRTPSSSSSTSSSNALTRRRSASGGGAGRATISSSAAGARQKEDAYDSSTSALVDSPKGKFSWSFPYSPETVELSQQLARGNDQVLKSIILDIKKREAKAAVETKKMGPLYTKFLEKMAKY